MSLAAPAHAQFQPAPGGLNQAPAPQREFARPSPSPWDQAPGSSPWDQRARLTPAGRAGSDERAAPGPSPFDRPAQAQMPPCMNEFAPLRDDTEKKAKAVQAASKRKPSPQEACKLFNALVAAQDKMGKFVAAKGASCGIPKEIGEQIKLAAYADRSGAHAGLRGRGASARPERPEPVRSARHIAALPIQATSSAAAEPSTR